MLPKNIHKIGIIEPMNLGDLLCSVPLFRTLRRSWPHAEIIFIGDTYTVPFYKIFGHYFDRMIVHDVDFAFGAVESLEQYISDVKSEQFDLLLKLYFWLGIKPETSFWDEHFDEKKSEIDQDTYWRGHERSIELTSSLNARLVAGIADPSACHPANFISAPYLLDNHVIESILGIAHQLDIPIDGKRLEFPVTYNNQQDARTLLQQLNIDQTKPLIGIHPGASVLFRRWPSDRFAAVADHLINKYDANILITGTKSEQEATNKVYNLIKNNSRVVNIAGTTSLGVLGALLDSMKLLISNDTGPIHIAYARDCPTVVIFGLESEATQWSGRNETLHKALVAENGNSPLTHANAIRAVTEAQVIKSVEGLLSRERA